jgi:tellurite resistance protein
MYPPPEFPPRRPAAFARTSPAIFPPILGLLGLMTAMRLGAAKLGLPIGIVDLATGMVVPLWGFAAFAYMVKLLRRISALTDDLKVMPSRAGLAAGTLGGMVAAGLLGGIAQQVAVGLLILSLVLHVMLVGLVVRVLADLPPEGRAVNPGWHMVFVGFIVAAPSAARLGLTDLAQVLLYATLPVAVVIWGLSAMQLVRRMPPAPLRPMLAIHLAPAALFATTASLTGHAVLSTICAWTAVAIGLTVLAGLRWIVESGFTPLWGAFTFPTAAIATALLLQGGALSWAGLGVLALGLATIPWIAWKVLRLWPGGRLAAITNAAEA